jgi:hypothetical protein
MGKKLLVALTMEGKFAGEGLQSIDEDDDMLSSIARELVERNGIGESADAVWRALNAEHQKMFATSQPLPATNASQINEWISAEPEIEAGEVAPRFVFGQSSAVLGKRARRARPAVPEQASLFS